MTLLPSDRFIRCAFYTPIGVTNVLRNEAGIVGDWKRKASDYYGDRDSTLAQRFANSPCDPDSIWKFTKRFGPLHGNPKDRRDGFSFSIDSWIAKQVEFMELWHRVQRRGGAAPFDLPEHIVVEFFTKRAVTLQLPNLVTFMCFELLRDAKRLRSCKRMDCQHSFFLAQHGKEQYCSIDCSNWAQSVWKKRWHEEQRKKRLESEEGNGTQKTR
jgi:hypothetical protein